MEAGLKSQTIKDTLCGVAIGDAFCVGNEFGDRHWLESNLTFEYFTNNRSNDFRDNLRPGDYSDDTEHTIAVIRALLSSQIFTPDLLLTLFREEYQNDKQVKGYGRVGHGSIRDWYEENATIEEVRAQQAARQDPGNAPFMRILPLAFLATEAIDSHATIVAECTHPHPAAIETAVAAARIGEYLIARSGDKSDVIAYVSQFITRDTTEKLERVSSLPSRELLSDQDWEFLCGPQPIIAPSLEKYGIQAYGLNCQSTKTLLAAFYVLLHSESANEALQNSAFMGGDIDSLAAYTVGIMAGLAGLGSLPQFLLTETEGLARIEMLAMKLYEKLKKLE